MLTAKDWAELNQACTALLEVVCPNTEEIAGVMRKRGSRYRTGSFHAAIHDLQEIAYKQHNMLHAEASVQRPPQVQRGGTRRGAGRPPSADDLLLVPPGDEPATNE